jgi:ligand-binding sensor domain-containing protein
MIMQPADHSPQPLKTLTMKYVKQMNSYFFRSKIFTLLLLSLSFTFCSGQVKTETHSEKEARNKSLKVPRAQGLNKAADIGFGTQDKEGNIWFGSYGEGVFKYDGKFFTQYTMSEGLNSNTTYSLVEDKAGNIWVGTNKGLNRFDGKKFENIPIVLSSTNLLLPDFYVRNPPAENKIWSMMADTKGIIWFGTDDGVYCFNGTKFTRFLDSPNLLNKDSLQLKGIFSIIEAKDGKIWFTACQSEGVSVLDGEILSNIIPYKDAGRTDRVIEDKNGTLWFACVFKGVGRYDGKKYTKNMFDEKAANGPSNIIEDAKGNIWFDTQDGLSYYDGNTLKIFNENDSLPNKKLIPVFLDNAGYLWLSGKGMKLYRYLDGKFIDFSE